MGWIPEPGGDGSTDLYTIVLIPDTQYLSETSAWTPHFQAAADWIADNVAARNIQLVLHLGDVVDNGNDTEFGRAATPMATIWGTGVPFVATIGNHDYDGGAPNNHTDTTEWNEHLGTDKYTVQPWWDGDFETADHSENLYFTVDLGGRPTLILVLEFFPRAAVMTWAEGVIEDHPLYDVIVLTHAYLHNDGTRTEDADGGGPDDYTLADWNNGEDMWDHLKQYRNVVAVFNGHHIGGDNVASRVDEGDEGNLVFQQFSNFQDETEGGEGTIVVLTVNPNTGWVHREIYNPVDDAFEVTYEGDFQLFASATADSDASAIHDDVAGEIQAVTEKATPVAADLVLIEDSEASYAKKSVQVGNLPGGDAAGRWELVVDPGTSDPPVAVTTPDGTDFVYALVED